MMYVVISIILGLGAWLLPLINLIQQKYDEKFNGINGYLSIVSFTLCLMSIYFQILLMKSYGDEWILVIDALGALTFAMPVLIVITIILNLLIIKKCNKR
ncbi:MAG: hypothetical protein R3Y65_05745 [Bacillota bacterium]|uniref:hypothetical protein n=1 Tax=Tannockella kyphosi TaxID=2899121 RepID=UPI002013594F|nr:hypothetical protein [Tannockella kyphosi]